MKKKITTIVSSLLLPALGVVFGLLIGAILLILQGISPVEAYQALIRGAAGSQASLVGSIIKSIPLGLVGIAVIISYKAGIFNIGGEGQFYFGAIGATAIGVLPLGLPPVLHIMLCILVAMLCGGLLALLPGYLKAYRGYNEIITTMLLNYIALLITSFLLQGVMQEPGSYFNQSALLQETAMLPYLIPGTRLHAGLLLLLFASGATLFLLKYTTLGFRMENVGLNRRAAFYAGENTNAIMLLAICLSGAIAGLAGAVEIMGVKGRLVENFVSGIGYDGIAVALLANLNPVGVLLSAFFFGAMRNGANAMQITTGASSAFVSIIQALAVFFVALMPGILKKIKRQRRTKHAHRILDAHL